MLSRFRYILLFGIMLFISLRSMAQLAMPDNVCIGALKHYYVDPVLGSTYTWRINGVLQGSTANAIDITWSTTGTYSLDVQEKSVDGCLGQLRSGEVFVTPLPSAPVVGTITQPTCSVATGSVVLTGLPTGTWTINPGSISGTVTSITISGLLAGTHNYTVTNSVGCTSVLSSNILINSQPITPTVVITNPAAVCSPSKIDLTNATLTTGSTSGLTYTYWTNSSATTAYTTPAEAVAGTYYIMGTTTSGCFDIKPVTVTVSPLPTAYAGPDLVLEYLFGATMVATEPGINEKGRWSVITGSGVFSDSTKANAEISGLALGENILLWKVSNEVCPPAFDSLTIVTHDLVIPTLITPNMDGKNDYFVLRGIETLGKTELIIFDRRGAQVYKNSNYDNSWNGVDYNGKPLLDDTYFFVIKAEKGKSFSGFIVVRR